MNLRTYVFQSIRFYRRTHLGVLIGTAIGGMILAGALIVGDSIRFSLKSLALSRLGRTEHALHTPNRFFRPALADDLAAQAGRSFCSLLQLAGSAAAPDGSSRANNIQVLGVDSAFWKLFGTESIFPAETRGKLAINRNLARRLNLKQGDTVVLRVERPGLLPRDSIMSTDTDAFAKSSFTIDTIVANNTFGRFSLKANQIPPLNAFLPLEQLQNLVELPGKANMILAAQKPGGPTDPKELDKLVEKQLTLADAGLRLSLHKKKNLIELTSDRIFLEDLFIDTITGSALSLRPAGVLTYLVNTIEPADKEHSGPSAASPQKEKYTPYSFVSAIGPLEMQSGADSAPPYADLLPAEKNTGRASEPTAITNWLAEDLGVKRDDQLKLTYYIAGRKQALEEKSHSFTVSRILPDDEPAIDRTLMPRYPGLSDVENCSNWNTGFPIKLELIRKKDETYWDTYRGTPKAFIPLAAGRTLWSNRFGSLTAIRFRAGDRPDSRMKAIREAMVKNIEPASLGLFFLPVRRQALDASTQALDFGQLFLGLSFFLLVASLLLVGLLFVFNIEQRTEETGILRASGIPGRTIRTLFLLEGLVLAAGGSAAGLILAVLYGKVVIYTLSTLWIGAVGTSSLYYHATWMSFVVGWGASVVMAGGAMFFTLRRQTRRTARELLSLGKSFETETGTGRRSFLRARSLRFGAALIVGAVVVIVLAGSGQSRQQTGAFFAAGALLLAGTLSLSYTLLSTLPHRSSSSHMNLMSLGFSNCVRRRFRSLAVTGLLATGSFMIIAVSANRRDPYRNVGDPASGTGGFELFANATIPIHKNLAEKDNLTYYGLKDETADKLEVVSMRIREGSDASCMNMNRVKQPQLVGVDPEAFRSRNAFTFIETMEGAAPDAGWNILNRKHADNVIPAVGDIATITWGLGSAVGDLLTYTDEQGNSFKVQIAGVIARSVFQGNLLIAEDSFIERFPSESGFRMFLGDVSGGEKEIGKVSAALTFALEDRGLAVIDSADRLASFDIVENTYLSIFQALGGLGLLLGSAGLAVVVIRNIMERRHEFALLRALGFQSGSVRLLVLYEHWSLVLLGLFSGTLSAFIAVLPALRSPDLDTPWVALAGIMALVLASALFWSAAAAYLALRGPLLDALRNE